MKTTILKINAVLCLSFTLMLLAASTGVNASSVRALPLKPFPIRSGDSILIFKQFADKSHRISLYPDANQKVIFFSVKGDEGKSYQLFVFDMDGNMVRQTEIRNKQTTLLKDIEKGVYLFQVFSNDEKIGTGRISVK
ncbi:MAG: T9SS type A sorting domain-containing protein [Flavitalea sp.]